MVHISYSAPRYPFTLTQSNQLGMIESETTYEGYCTFFEDHEIQCSFWEVEAYVTGFTQYQNGKVVASVTDIRSADWTVDNLEAFEAACVDAATFQQQLKAA